MEFIICNIIILVGVFIITDILLKRLVNAFNEAIKGDEAKTELIQKLLAEKKLWKALFEKQNKEYKQMSRKLGIKNIKDLYGSEVETKSDDKE